MDRDHRIPEVLGRVGEALVAQDAGVVDEDVDLAEGREGGLQDVLAARDVRDVVVARDGLAAGGLDPGDDRVRHREAPAPEPSRAPPRSLTTTAAPSAARASACSRPRPPPAPVTIATFPSSKPMSVSFESMPSRRVSRVDRPPGHAFEDRR
jgi:hypothetical protein